MPRDRVIYVGDRSSDLHVMLHVNRTDRLPIAESIRSEGAPSESAVAAPTLLASA